MSHQCLTLPDGLLAHSRDKPTGATAAAGRTTVAGRPESVTVKATTTAAAKRGLTVPPRIASMLPPVARPGLSRDFATCRAALACLGKQLAPWIEVLAGVIVSPIRALTSGRTG
jgi:hypothetical protein